MNVTAACSSAPAASSSAAALCANSPSHRARAPARPAPLRPARRRAAGKERRRSVASRPVAHRVAAGASARWNSASITGGVRVFVLGECVVMVLSPLAEVSGIHPLAWQEGPAGRSSRADRRLLAERRRGAPSAVRCRLRASGWARGVAPGALGSSLSRSDRANSRGRCCRQRSAGGRRVRRRSVHVLKKSSRRSSSRSASRPRSRRPVR